MTAVELACTRCPHVGPPEDFAIDRARPNGRTSWCKPCRREWARDYRKRHPEKERNANLKQNYGITLADYNTMFAKQSGRCAICGTVEPGGHGGKHFHVDHDHATGRVRGLLCASCNNGLARFGEDTDRMLVAINYLKHGGI